MATLLTDTFTGTDGAAWDPAKWALGHDPVTGGGATIENNLGRLASGNTGSYSPADRIARRFNVDPVADLEIRLDFDLGGEVYPWVFLRASSPTDWAVSCYAVSLGGGPPAIRYVNNYSSTSLATAITAPTDVCTLRFRAIGDHLQARFWPAGTPEPTNWNIGTVTHSAIAEAGHAGLAASGGGPPVAGLLYVNDLTVTTSDDPRAYIRVGGVWQAPKIRSGGAWVTP